MRLIGEQTVLFAPLDLVVSSSSATPEAQQHSLPQRDFSVTHNIIIQNENIPRSLKYHVSVQIVLSNVLLLMGFSFASVRHGCENLLAAQFSAPACSRSSLAFVQRGYKENK